MATKRIETELTIKAVDRYSALVKSMGKVTGRFADKVRTDMKGLQKLRGPLKLIEDFKKAREAAKKSGADMEAAREKLRKLEYQFKTAKTKTSQMYRELEKARSATTRLEGAHRRNRRALDGLHTGLRKAGVNTADLAGEQRRLVGALDASTGAFDRQMGKMRSLARMQDTIATARSNMDKSLARSANLSFVGNASMQTGRRILDKVTGVANRAGDRQANFTEFQNLTGASDGRISGLKEELQALRAVTKQSIPEMLDGLSVLVGKGMDLEDALTALPATGRAAKATATEFDQMANSGFALFDNLKVAPSEMRKAFDIMAMAGKEGGFELTAMARKFPEVTAGARGLKMEGLDAAASLSAALQIAMKSAGSEDQAATNMANFFGKITAVDTVKKFKKIGVDIEKEMKSALERGVDPMEHMLLLIEKKTGGDAFKMGELFADKQVLDFLRAMIPNLEEYRRIKQESLGADGVVDADLARVMQDFNEQKGQLREAFGELFTLPPETLESFTALLKKTDAIVEKMILWKKEHPELTKWLFVGAAAVGSMAVAGGFLLTTAAGLIGTLAVLKFGLVVLGAKALFAGGGMAGLVGTFATLRKLPKFALSGLLKPVKWGAKLVSRVPWAVLTGGKFMLSGLLSPIRWTARFIGCIPWATLVGGKFALRTLVTGLKWTTRLIPGIGWAVLAGELAWHLLLKKLPWSDWIDPVKWREWFSFKWADVLPTWSWDFIPALDLSGWITWPDPPAWLKWLMGQEETAGVSQVPGFSQLPGDQQEAARTVQPYGEGAGLPTKARLSELSEDVIAYREEVEAAQAALQAAPEFSSGITNPLRVQAQTDLDAAEAGLRAAQDELAKTEQASGKLQSALQVLSGTTATPEISTTSIDQALDKVTRLSAKLEAMPGAKPAGATSPSAKPAVAGKRALGGPVSAGLPYLVNEHTPRSEIFVPSGSGAILNVGQAQKAMASRMGQLASGAGRLAPRLGGSMFQGMSAGLAAMAVSSAVLPTAVQAGNAPSVQTPAGGGRDVRVEIGSVNIAVPSGVSDPEAIVSLMESSLGERLKATMDASFAD